MIRDLNGKFGMEGEYQKLSNYYKVNLRAMRIHGKIDDSGRMGQ
jgi:hypothetical protein